MRDAAIISLVAILILLIALAVGLPYLRYVGMRSHGMYQAMPVVLYGEPVSAERFIEL
jgi:hypothetical protein